MKLDLRFPIGLMFTVVGGLVTIYGLLSDPAIYEKSLKINVNFWWGGVMLVFGLLMLVAGWRAQRKSIRAASARTPAAKPAGPTAVSGPRAGA